MTAEPPPRGATSPTARILVVEDEPNIRRVCAVRLSRLGHAVVTADDGEAAWSALQAADYDLVITDHEMPRLTGLGLLRRMRDAGFATPGMLTSGRIPVDDPELRRLVPPEARLPKPFSIEELVAKTNALLRQAGAR